MAYSLFTQQWRRNEACFDLLRAAVTAEVAAETEMKRRETDRVNSENNARRTAAAAAAAATPTTPAVASSVIAEVTEATKHLGDGGATTADANNRSSRDCCDDDAEEDAGGSQILIPVSRSAAKNSGRAAVAPWRSSSSGIGDGDGGSGGGGSSPRPISAEGESSTAPRGGGRAPAVADKLAGSGVPEGRGTDASATDDTTCANHTGGRNDDDGHRRPTVMSAVAATVVGRSAPPATAGCATTKKGRGYRAAGTNTAAYRFLEDLIPAGPRSTGRALPRRFKPRPLTNANTGGNTNGKESRNKKQKRKAAPASASAATSGPFSELSLCVVHLGSVTSSTIKAFSRGVRDGGGGRVSTRYEPGNTTHIVADASLALSWEELHSYFAGCLDGGDGFDFAFEDDLDAAAVMNADGAATVRATATTRARTRTPGDVGVPIVSNEWVVECLRLSAVVAVGPYRLMPPRRAAAAETAPAAAAALARRHDGSSTSASVTWSGPVAAAAAETVAATTTAAATAYKRKLDARDDDDDDGGGPKAVASAQTHGRRTQAQEGAATGGGGGGCRGGGSTVAAGGGAAAEETMLEAMGEVKGGFGAREPDVGKRRHKFHCQFTSSRDDHVSRAGPALTLTGGKK